MKTEAALLFLLSTLLVTASCDFMDGDYPFTGSIEGSYTWTSTTGGFAGVTITPDSVDYTQKLKIDDNQAFLYRNNELMQAFKIRYEKKEWMDEKSWVFYPQKGELKISYFIHNKIELKRGRLTLFPSCTDCYSLHFKKI